MAVERLDSVKAQAVPAGNRPGTQDKPGVLETNSIIFFRSASGRVLRLGTWGRLQFVSPQEKPLVRYLMHSRSATRLPRFLARTLTLSIKSALALGAAKSNSRAPMVRSRSVTSARSAGVACPAGPRPVSVVRLSGVARETGAARVAGGAVPNQVEQCGTSRKCPRPFPLTTARRVWMWIRHSNSSGAVCQFDLAAPFDGLGQGRVRGHHCKR